MKTALLPVLLCVFVPCEVYKILGIFPYNGRSHHIIFSSLIEELASRNHEVTLVNYFPVKKIPTVRQISIQDESGGVCNINMKENLKNIPASIFVDFYRAYDMAVTFKEMGDDNCERLMTNNDIRKIITSEEKYDLVIVEQFVTDCGLAIAFKLNAPVVGVTAHIMMPWTYSRLGAPDNPAFVPNHLFATGAKPNFWKKIQSAIINLCMNAYYRYAIQKSNQLIVNRIYPEVPDLEILGNNISLIMLNQYFPLTGSRLYGANVIEVGGMHVKEDSMINDKDLKEFLDTAENGVVYISFGTVAQHFPSQILEEILSFIKKTNMRFIWKVDNVTDKAVPKNLLMRTWLPQLPILCHRNVLAFVSHTGMLSTTEAVHCGIPIIAVPLFGDQFSNAAAILENDLGVVLDIYALNSEILGEALQTVLQDRYRNRAKEFEKIWKDRPRSAMDTAVFWVEYVAKHQEKVNMRPPTVHLSNFEYFNIDLLLVSVIFVQVVIYSVKKILSLTLWSRKGKMNKRHKTRKTE